MVVVKDHRTVLPNFDNPSCIRNRIAIPVDQFIAARMFNYEERLVVGDMGRAEELDLQVLLGCCRGCSRRRCEIEDVALNNHIIITTRLRSANTRRLRYSSRRMRLRGDHVARPMEFNQIISRQDEENGRDTNQQRIEEQGESLQHVNSRLDSPSLVWARGHLVPGGRRRIPLHREVVRTSMFV